MEFYKLYYRIHNRDDWWRLKNYIAWLAFCKLTFDGGNEMDNFIKTNDPNDKWGEKIVEITLMQWEYVGHIYCVVGGNCSGKDVLDFADFEIDDFMENPKDFELHYDEGSDFFTYELHDSEGNTLEGDGERYEMNEMIVSIRLVEKIPDGLKQ